MESFFGVGLPELILILIVAGVVMGPERIGQAARWLGRLTAELQVISRGFMQQLNRELDQADESGALKETMHDIQALRQELAQLRGELNATVSGTIQDGRKVVTDIERSIKPPTLTSPPAANKGPAAGGAPAANGSATADRTPTSGSPPPAFQLPNVLDIPDDPE